MTEAPLTPQRVEAIVTAFAVALDADDFAAVGRLIGEACIYETGRETLAGRAAIIASYASASAWAIREFDEVRYESRLVETTADSATVEFTDYLLKTPGRWHRHRCRQVITVRADGAIIRIVHREVGNERERLEVFLRNAGSGTGS